uniref:CCHC-type domain-containing protein n=1 Tax=Haemonchus contortus TaxID=6289 RepID=A0A7I4YF00_HAECO
MMSSTKILRNDQNHHERIRYTAMPCAFCGRRGDHYSDSCTAYMFTEERWGIVDRETVMPDVPLLHLFQRATMPKASYEVLLLQPNWASFGAMYPSEKSARIQDELELLQRRYDNAQDRVHRLDIDLRGEEWTYNADRHGGAGNIAAIREWLRFR